MKKKKINKILIANRGEIALRLLRSIKKAGKQSVAVFAANDRDLPFTFNADEAWSLGSGELSDTYLNQNKIIEIALKSGADAIHPGYGFLSENAEFAEKCRKNKLVFIGPGPELIMQMGNKSNARQRAKEFNVPIIEGLSGTVDEILGKKDFFNYPVLIKPSAGGGGKGMKIVNRKEALSEALFDASRESMAYFGSSELYVEHYIEKARHIEVQILADDYGNTLHLYDRECSLQRRFQKIIEEAPSASISEATRKKILQSAIALSKGIGYSNAGTLEFLLDENENFFFIEMNTRIQVEHPVTEMITGIDIVAEQIHIAEGKELRYKQEDLKIKGHAIEARIYAEDPKNAFMPSTGMLSKLDISKISERTDLGYEEGNSLTASYDPMIAKIIAHGDTRQDATKKLTIAIGDFHVKGVISNREFLMNLLKNDFFVQNKLHTRTIDSALKDLINPKRLQRPKAELMQIVVAMALMSLESRRTNEETSSVWKDIGHWRLIPEIKIELNSKVYSVKYERINKLEKYRFSIENKDFSVCQFSLKNDYFTIEINGFQLKGWTDVNQSEITLDLHGYVYQGRRTDIADSRYTGKSASAGRELDVKEIQAPLNGKVVKINVDEKDKVKNSDVLLIIESMKMENKITSPRAAEIQSIHVKVGDLVELNKVLITLK